MNCILWGGCGQNPEAIVANVWNYDSKWKVNWYENGKLKGEVTNFLGFDVNIVKYTIGYASSFKHKYWGAGLTEHLFYAVPEYSDSEILVEVIDCYR